MPELKFTHHICPECGAEYIGTYCDNCDLIEVDADEVVEDDYSENDYE